MIELKYINSNPNHSVLNFWTDGLHITSGNFHSHAWSPITSEQTIGSTVSGFGKAAVQYECTITLRGSLEKRHQVLDSILEIFEYDVLRSTPGKLYYGDEYIECFAVASDTQISSQLRSRTDVKISLYCPKPFWIKKQSRSFEPASGTSITGLNYPYNYAYNYTPDEAGHARWVIDHYADSDFSLTIFGPCVNPSVTINGYTYLMNMTLVSGEYVVINSIDRTITKTGAGGARSNAFNLRGKTNSVFRKIPSGELVIGWSGSFGFDVDLFLERSEPRWHQ